MFIKLRDLRIINSRFPFLDIFLNKILKNNTFRPHFHRISHLLLNSVYTIFRKPMKNIDIKKYCTSHAKCPHVWPLINVVIQYTIYQEEMPPLYFHYHLTFNAVIQFT